MARPSASQAAAQAATDAAAAREVQLQGALKQVTADFREEIAALEAAGSRERRSHQHQLASAADAVARQAAALAAAAQVGTQGVAGTEIAKSGPKCCTDVQETRDLTSVHVNPYRASRALLRRPDSDAKHVCHICRDLDAKTCVLIQAHDEDVKLSTASHERQAAAQAAQHAADRQRMEQRLTEQAAAEAAARAAWTDSQERLEQRCEEAAAQLEHVKQEAQVRACPCSANLIRADPRSDGAIHIVQACRHLSARRVIAPGLAVTSLKLQVVVLNHV